MEIILINAWSQIQRITYDEVQCLSTGLCVAAMELCPNCWTTTGRPATELGTAGLLAATTTTTAAAAATTAAAVCHQSAIPAVVWPAGSTELLHKWGRGHGGQQVAISGRCRQLITWCCSHCKGAFVSCVHNTDPHLVVRYEFIGENEIPECTCFISTGHNFVFILDVQYEIYQ